MKFKSRVWSVYRWIMKMRCKFKPPKGIIKMFLKMWKEEFRVQKFKLSYHTPEEFTRCCWQQTERVEPMWLAYRTLVGFYFFATTIYTIFRPTDEAEKHFIFLTHWTYELEFIQFFLAFIITVIKYEGERKNPNAPPMESMPWYYKVYWVLFTIVLSSSLVVSIIFWVFVYDPVDYPANFINLMVHALNAFFMLLDFCLVAHPVRFLHFYWPTIYGITYIIFSVIYQTSGGTGVKGLIPIYKILDWRDPLRACITCLMCYFIFTTLHVLFSSISCLKSWMRRKNSGGSGDQR